MATSRNLDDIELTDFDNDGIFVIHPKPRRNSSESCHTFETDLGGSTPSIETFGTESVSDDIQITEIVEQENDSNPPAYDEEGMPYLENQNPQLDLSNHVTIDIDEDEQERSINGHGIMDINNESEQEPDLPTNEPEIVDIVERLDEQNADSGFSSALAHITLIGHSTRNFWNTTKAYFYIDLKKSFNWTIVQTWYNLAFIQCVVPFYIRQNVESGQFERFYCRPQQILWLISKVILILDMVGWIPLIIQGLGMEPTPYTYLNMGGFVAIFLLRCVFLRLSCCDTGLFVDYINKSVNLEERISEENRWYIKSRTITFAGFFASFVLHITAVLLELFKYILNMGSTLDLNLKEMVSVYACYGKQVILWTDTVNCVLDEQEITELHAESIAFSAFGVVAYIIGVMNQTNISMLLLSGSLSLLLDVIVVRNLEPLNTLQKFNTLKETAARISNMIGTLMIVYMTHFAISMPGWLQLIFATHTVMLLLVLFNVILMFTFAIVGCIASLYIDRIKCEMIEPEEVEQLPVDLRQFTALMHKLFQNSVGISFYDLFVLNFRLLFSYVCIISSIVVVIYESMKDGNTSELNPETSVTNGLMSVSNVTSHIYLH